MEITEHRGQPSPDAKFSILIPTWNNLPLLKLCVRSLRAHSAQPHQIILHINEGTDGSLQWAIDEGLDHSHSTTNVGVCHALNAAAQLATTERICFFNDDMYALPGWDQPLLEEIAKLDHELWFLSGTMVEPTDTGNPCVLAPKDFGRDPDDFREADLLQEYPRWHKEDWTGATWPPNVLPRSLWEAVGGYSPEFSPGMSSDPDFSMKLWTHGVRHFKGLAASRVYHFQAKSTGKVQKNDGRHQFLQKWGLTQSTFTRYYLRRGQPWSGPLGEPRMGPGLLYGRLKSMVKKLF